MPFHSPFSPHHSTPTIGTGKTLLARAVANRTDACFIRVIGSELVQKCASNALLVPLALSCALHFAAFGFVHSSITSLLFSHYFLFYFLSFVVGCFVAMQIRGRGRPHGARTVPGTPPSTIRLFLLRSLILTYISPPLLLSPLVLSRWLAPRRRA